MPVEPVRGQRYSPVRLMCSQPGANRALPAGGPTRADAHAALDAAVAAAYGWSADITDDDALRELLQLNEAPLRRATEPAEV